MAKVDLKLVEMVLKRHDLDIKTIAEIVEEIEVEVKGEVEDEEKPPVVKKQHIILVSDPHGQLVGTEYVGWVIQVPEEESPYEVEQKIAQAAYDFNATPKGRKIPIRTISEACEVIPARFFKEQKTWIKTKEPVLVVTTRNKIALEPIRKAARNEADFEDAA